MKRRRLALLVGVPLALLAVVEVGLRLAEPAEPPFADRLARAVLALPESDREWFPHPRFGHTLPTGEGNALGFDAPEPTPLAAAPGGTRRLLLLGDDGLRVDATTIGPYEVHDYTMFGYNTVQAVAVATVAVPLLSPERVVVGFDLKDDPLANTLVTFDDPRYVPLPGALPALRHELLARLDLGGVSAIERRWALGPGAPRLRRELAAEPAVVLRAAVLLDSLRDVAAEFDARVSVVLLVDADSPEALRRTYAEVFREKGLDVAAVGRGGDVTDAVRSLVGETP